jgi:hypothetical protein
VLESDVEPISAVPLLLDVAGCCLAALLPNVCDSSCLEAISDLCSVPHRYGLCISCLLLVVSMESERITFAATVCKLTESVKQ